jgi:hypothetical protein
MRRDSGMVTALEIETRREVEAIRLLLPRRDDRVKVGERPIRGMSREP